MHYKYLSELGSHYNAEEGTEGVRVAALAGLESALNTAIVDLNSKLQAAKLNAPTYQTISVKNMAQFFQQTANDTMKTKAELDGPEVLAARAKVERLKKWLVMQGAVIKDDGKIDWGLSGRTVVYDRDLAARQSTMLKYNAGKIYLDESFERPLDTKNMVTHFSGPGFAIYVMSEQGNIHISSHSVGNRHHSSLLAGMNVAGAGELQVSNSRLSWISNKSGHYAPSTPHFIQTLHQLQKSNVDLTNVKVRFHTASGKTEFPTVGAFLASLGDDDRDYEWSKLVRYLKYIPAAEFVNLAASKGWRWRTPAEATGGAPNGVYTTAGVFVAHKIVRKWLKSIGKVAQIELQDGWGR